MKNIKHFGYAIACITLVGLLLSGCKKDKASAPAPTASFSVTVNGLSISMLTVQTNATSYSWNFGDTINSTAVQSSVQNPTHTYKSSGTYTVTLTAKGDGGSVTVTQSVTTGTVVQPSGINLKDNSFSDWDTIAVAWRGTDTIGLPGASTLRVLKLKQTKDSLYVYLETTSKISDSTYVCMFFDTDNDPTTGYQTYMYDNTVTAFDYVYQGRMFLKEAQGVQQYTGATASSNWTWKGLSDANFTVFGYVGASKTTSSNTAIEFAYIKSGMEGPWDKKVTLGLYESDKSWSEIGIFPSKRHVPNKPLVINLD